MMCGTGICSGPEIMKSCAVALAVRDIAPDAEVSNDFIHWTGGADCIKMSAFITRIPPEVKRRIRDFDDLQKYPSHRLNLGEFSFETDFPDELVNEIGINEVKAILEKSETLELA